MANRVAVNEKGFTVLYESPHPVVDIVFVHGFTGHPKDTWTWKRSQSKKIGTKRHSPVEPAIEVTRRSKIPRLQLFGRSASASSSISSPTPASSRVPTEKSTEGHDKIVPDEQGSQDVYWPADLACKTVPDSRILTYGYDTAVRHWVSGPVSKKTLYDHAWDFLCDLEARRRNPTEKLRPIVFVAHSLGGILVKEALRRLRGCHSLKPHLYTIFEATSSILFFGTPHGGADPRNAFHHILSAFARALGVQVNEQIVDTLMPKAERLTELRDEFSAMLQERKWTIYSYQEEYPLQALFGTKVVEDQSSCLNNSAYETRRFIAENHMDMCRFERIQDTEYMKVAAALEHILSTIRERRDAVKGNSPLTGTRPRVSHLLQDAGSGTAPPESQHSSNAPLIGDRSISDETRKSLIDQLYFDKIDDRLTNLTAAQGKTCRWFLTEPKYISWRDPSGQPGYGGFLWIKGNPGTGKSTLIKFLFEEAKSKAKGDPSQLLLSFFFLARGVLEEKSTLGLYRSLLHQLFQKAADLQDSLEWMTVDGARGIQADGWREEALKQTFRHAVRKLDNRALTIFVDALDECEDSQARDMVSFFEEICELAQEAQVRLRICLSSRHYPHIENSPDIELVLEDETGHKEDIEQYIAAKLRLRKTKAAQSLQAEILKRSSLIFLWVVLVVDILNSEYPGKPLDKMRKRLEEIPPKLADLFEMILTRDGQDPKMMQLCLQWILFAFRPLKPQELYFAVHLGLKDGSLPGQWDQETVNLDMMKAFVRSSSKGLAEVTRNKAAEVQFIHESVRDFLLGKYGGHWSGADRNFEGQAHQAMRDCCLSQLEVGGVSLHVGTRNSQLDEENSRTDDEASATQPRDLRLKYPFVEYSTLNVLRHADSAQHHGLQQHAFLAAFPLPLWIAAHNTLERFAIRRYEKTTPLVYILAEKDLANLIRVLPQKESCFTVAPDERYGPPIFAALAVGSDETVQALLEAEVRAQPPEDQPQLDVLYKSCLEKYGMPAKLGVNFKFSKTVGVPAWLARLGSDALLAIMLNSDHLRPHLQEPSRRTPLSCAAEMGHQTAVRLLLEKGALINATDTTDFTALMHGAAGGHEAIVEILLENGADVNHQSSRDYRSALSYAAEHGHFAIAQMLLGKSAETNNVSSYGGTPLSYAVSNGHELVAELLLERGAAVDLTDMNFPPPLFYAVVTQQDALVALFLENGADADWKSEKYTPPLSYAAELGSESMIRLLIDAGATVDATNSSGRTALSFAAEHGHEAIAKLLLRSGAHPNTRSDLGRTPLSYAAEMGHVAVVRLLLVEGAQVDLEHVTRVWTPLTYAAFGRREDVARILLEAGAGVDIKDTAGRTPISLAASQRAGQLPLEKFHSRWIPDIEWKRATLLPTLPPDGGISVAMLLLEKGADANSRDKEGRTPLSHAAQRGCDSFARILLLNGANADLASTTGRTPLSFAAEGGHVDMVRLLLEADVEVNSKDISGKSPLLYAAQHGHKAVVSLLMFEKGASVEADLEGKTPQSYALREGHRDIADLLSTRITRYLWT